MGKSFNLLLLLSFWVFLSCSSGSQVVTTIDAEQARNLLHSAGYTYLDVRLAEDYKKGHVDAEKIFNIPYYLFKNTEGRVKNPNFLKEVSSVCKDEDTIIVGCGTGNRSLLATSDLLNSGFKNVSNMGEGYLGWMKMGFPVKEEEGLLAKPTNPEQLRLI